MTPKDGGEPTERESLFRITGETGRNDVDNPDRPPEAVLAQGPVSGDMMRSTAIRGLLTCASLCGPRADRLAVDPQNPGPTDFPHYRRPTIRPTISAILGLDTLKSMDRTKM